MKRAALLAGVSMLAACQPLPRTAAARLSGDSCGAGRVQDAIGHRRSETLARAVQRRSGAAALRFLVPGETHTMEFRADRLNLTLDEAGRITRVSCG